jgi:hypothetical protein
MSNAAHAQGMATNVTYVQNQSPDMILQNVRTCADVAAKAGVRLVVACAQFMIVRAYHMNDQERWPVDRSRDFLKAQLGYQGLKTASSYRYIQTGLALAQGILARHKLGGVMADVLTAKNENKAFETLLKCTIDHGYLKPGVTGPTRDWNKDANGAPTLSMDTLRVNLGLDKLEVPAPAPVVDANNPGAALATPSAPETPATKAAPKTIIARLRADKDLVKSIPTDIIIGAAATNAIGREKMAERLVSLMTLEEIVQLQAFMANRLQELAKEPVKAEETKTEPATVPKPETPVETETTADQTETPPARRSRTRNRRAA